MPETRSARRSTGVEAYPPFACSWSDWGRDAGWIHVVGELDLATSAQLTQALDEAQRRARLVVLDLRDLTFMDCLGLHPIIAANVRARADGRHLLVVRGPAPVHRLLQLTGVVEYLEILDLTSSPPPLQQPRRHPPGGHIG